MTTAASLPVIMLIGLFPIFGTFFDFTPWFDDANVFLKANWSFRLVWLLMCVFGFIAISLQCAWSHRIGFGLVRKRPHITAAKPARAEDVSFETSRGLVIARVFNVIFWLVVGGSALFIVAEWAMAYYVRSSIVVARVERFEETCRYKWKWGYKDRWREVRFGSCHGMDKPDNVPRSAKLERSKGGWVDVVVTDDNGTPVRGRFFTFGRKARTAKHDKIYPVALVGGSKRRLVSTSLVAYFGMSILAAGIGFFGFIFARSLGKMIRNTKRKRREAGRA